MDRSVIKRLATQCGIYNGDKEARFEQIESFANAIAAHEQRQIYTNTDHGFVMKDRFFQYKGNGYIQDENFDYDAGLSVSGDFPEGGKDKYCQMLCEVLNQEFFLSKGNK